MKLAIGFFIGYIMSAVVIHGCAPAKSSGSPYAIQINSINNARCFVIMSSDDKAVGGNCQ